MRTRLLGLMLLMVMALGLCLAPGALAEGLVSRDWSLEEREDILSKVEASLAPAQADGPEAALMEEVKAEILGNLDRATLSDVVPLSLSPDGKTWLGAAGTVPFLYIPETGEARAVLVDMPGSAQNQTYGFSFVMRMMETWPGGLYEAHSFHWSPDSRYVALTFWKMVMMQMRGEIDLYVVDTQAGTLRMARTFEGRNMLSDGAASVMQACFSADSRTLYHAVFGGLPEGRATVWAHSLDDGSNTFLASAEKQGDDVIYGDLAQLILLPDGGLMQIMDPPKIGVPRGLFTYAPREGGAWERREHPLPVTSFMPWEVVHGQGNLWLLRFRSYGLNTSFAFSVMDVNEDFKGMDQLLLLRSFEAQQAQVLPLTETVDGEEGAPSQEVLDAYAPNLLASDPTTPGTLPASPALLLAAAARSPEGDRALLMMQDPQDQQFGFMMLDLETLEAVPVDYAWSEEVVGRLQHAMARQSLVALHWAQDGQVVLSLGEYALPLVFE